VNNPFGPPHGARILVFFANLHTSARPAPATSLAASIGTRSCLVADDHSPTSYPVVKERV